MALSYDEEMNRRWHEGYEVYRRYRTPSHPARDYPRCPCISPYTGEQCKNRVSLRQTTCYIHRQRRAIPFLNREALRHEIATSGRTLTEEQQALVCLLYERLHVFDPWHTEPTRGVVERLAAAWNDDHLKARILSGPSDPARPSGEEGARPDSHLDTLPDSL